jgi:hypothetical protein
MSLIDVANEECQRLRQLKLPYTAPELLPNPPIGSSQVRAALFAVEQELVVIKKQLAEVVAKTAANTRIKQGAKRPHAKRTS